MSKYRRRIKSLLTAFIIASVCASCGNSSSSSGSSSDSTKKTVSGVVSDPEIKDAKVSLYRDGVIQPFFDATDRNANQVVTDSNGVFTFKISSGKDISNWVIKSTGGFDTVTGESLNDVELKTSLKLFTDSNSPVVSPLTSLVTDELENGIGVSVAMNKVNAYLGFPAGTDLAVNPTSQTELLEKSVLVTKLVKQLKDNGKASPVRVLRDALADNPLVTGDEINDALLIDVIPDEDQRAGLKEDFKNLKEDLKTPGSFAKKAYLRTMSKTIRGVYMAQNSVSRTTFNKDSDKNALIASFKTVAEKIIAAMPEKISSDKQEKAVLYVMQSVVFEEKEIEKTNSQGIKVKVKVKDLTNTFKKDTFIAVNTLSPKLDTFLALEETKKQLAAIASFAASTRYIASVPLTPAQLLGNDNTKRVEYYYNSNVSNTYFEQKVLENLQDDRVADPVYADLACTWAEAGEFDKANAYVNNNVYQADEKMNAHRCVGRAYAKFNRYPEGVAQIKLAETALKKRIDDALGLAQVTRAEADDAFYIAEDYSRLNSHGDAKAILDYVADTIVPQLGNATTYSETVTLYRDAIDRAMGNIPDHLVIEMIDKAAELAKEIPEHSRTGHTLRYGSLAELSLRYAKVNHEAGVKALVGTEGEEAAQKTLWGIWSKATEKHKKKFENPTIDAAKALSIIGEYAIAKDLTDEIVVSIIPGFPQYSAGVVGGTKAKLQPAIYKSLNGDLDAGWSEFEKIAETYKMAAVELLAYTKTNRNDPQLGAMMVGKGDTDKVKRLFEKEIAFLDKFVASSDAKELNDYNTIANSGYRNIGMLYLEIGEQAEAVKAFQKAENLFKSSKMESSARGFNYGNTINGLVTLARVYQDFDKTKSKSLLDDAASYFEKSLFTQETKLSDKVNLSVGVTGEWKSRKFWGLDYSTRIPFTVFDSYLLSGYKDDAKKIADMAFTAVNQIKDNVKNKYGEDDPGIKISRLFEVATAYNRLRNTTKVKEVLTVAKRVVADAVKLPGDKVTHTQNIAAAYAKAFLYEDAIATANSIGMTGPRNKAFGAIANAYKNVNLFPGTYVARFDFDGDGQPDFFNKYATPAHITESGLSMDEDIDGDGVFDTDDTTPYVSSL